MQFPRSDLWQKISFCTCSYLQSIGDYRASLVIRAMQSWDKLLELPFAEKIFLDDLSPDLNGMKILQSSNQLNKFDDVRYNTMSHPPHSNFGILISMNICQNDYILHVDDDVTVSGGYEECLNLLENSLNILNENENILGINLLNLSSNIPQPWQPDRDYPKSDIFAHPHQYFETAACLMKKQLLEKVRLTDIINWGEKQPAHWEKLVSDNPSSFLVSKIQTPLIIEDDSWTFSSTTPVSVLGKYKYFLFKKLGLKVT